MSDSQNSKTCPNCGKPLQERKGKFGKFLGCTGYPDCKFTYNLEVDNEWGRKRELYCPKCNNLLEIKKGKKGDFLGCSAYSDCDFIFNLI
jgi:DNA topoisomerase-1